MKRTLLCIFLCTAVLLTGCTARKQGGTILMVMADKDFYDPEYTMPREALEKAGYDIEVANISGGKSIGIEKLEVPADLALKNADESRYTAIVLVGGYGAASLYDNMDLITLIQAFHESDKVVSAQCFAPIVIAQSGILNGKKATCWHTQAQMFEQYSVEYSGEVVEIEGNIVTAMAGSPENINAFSDALLARLGVKGGKKKKAPEKQESELAINSDERSFTMIHAGNKRSGRLFVPASYDGNKPFSLVLGLHGHGGSGRDFEGTGFNEYAGRFDFIMVYPDGLNGEWDVAPGVKSARDDLGFMKRLIARMQQKYSIDPERIYVTGHSMGGFMSYRLAYDLSDMITAIAPVAGLAVQPAGEKPGHPVSILHQHAVDDTIVDPSGTMNGAYSMKESLEMWKNINGIKASPVTEKDRYGTLVRQWKDAEGGVEIRSILYQEGGHAWPIGATERAASFFYTHPSRETQLVMETQSETGIIHNMDPLVFHANISNPDSVKKVRLVSNGKEIQETDQSPFQLSFIPNMNTHYDMYMIAELADGSTVASINTVSCTICRKNIAQNAQVITSGDENDSLPGKHALDGNMRTRWSSEWDDDQYIQIDLGSKKTVSGFSLLWETAYGRAYELQVSDDGTEWSRVYQEDDSDGGTDFIAVDPVDTRHVRLIGKKRGTKWGYSLYEFMVHGS